jgi:hypothetical protein
MRISSGGGIMLPGIWGQKQTGWWRAHAQTARKNFSLPGIGRLTSDCSLQQSQRPLPQIKEHSRIIVLL